jgi:hypothetical protein
MKWGMGWFTVWIVCMGTAIIARADDPAWKITGSATYETGTFGTGSRTNILYVPFTLKRYFNSGDFSVTLPYMIQETGGSVTTVEGVPVQIKHKKKEKLPTTTEEGVGDLTIQGGYDLLQENRQPLDLALIGRIKFPTADETKGLGTGEFDEGVGLEFGKRIKPVWTVFADFYYTWIGSPPGIHLENRLAVDFGVANQLRPALTASLFYEESTPLVRGNPAPRDLLINLEKKVSKTTRLFMGGILGLSNGSPDAGLTTGAAVRF